MEQRLKNELKPWLVEEWCIPKAGAEFVAAMEDVLEVYQHPYAPEYPVVCMDEANRQLIEETHPPSLYDAFPPEEALRLANRLEIHYTPKHGSWLDMAEIEIGVMSRQCLKGYLSDKEAVMSQVNAWVDVRNSRSVSVNWHFTTSDARTKLKSLYPVIV